MGCLFKGTIILFLLDSSLSKWVLKMFLLNFWRWNNCHLHLFDLNLLQGLLFCGMVGLELNPIPLFCYVEACSLSSSLLTFVRNLIFFKLNRICGLDLNILPFNLSNHALTFRWIFTLFDRLYSQLMNLGRICFLIGIVLDWWTTKTLRIVNWVIFPTIILLVLCQILNGLTRWWFHWVRLITVIGHR